MAKNGVAGSRLCGRYLRSRLHARSAVLILQQAMRRRLLALAMEGFCCLVAYIERPAAVPRGPSMVMVAELLEAYLTEHL